jgi:hypothetical protein
VEWNSCKGSSSRTGTFLVGCDSRARTHKFGRVIGLPSAGMCHVYLHPCRPRLHVQRRRALRSKGFCQTITNPVGWGAYISRLNLAVRVNQSRSMPHRVTRQSIEQSRDEGCWRLLVMGRRQSPDRVVVVKSWMHWRVLKIEVRNTTWWMWSSLPEGGAPSS